MPPFPTGSDRSSVGVWIKKIIIRWISCGVTDGKWACIEYCISHYPHTWSYYLWFSNCPPPSSGEWISHLTDCWLTQKYFYSCCHTFFVGWGGRERGWSHCYESWEKEKDRAKVKGEVDLLNAFHKEESKDKKTKSQISPRNFWMS